MENTCHIASVAGKLSQLQLDTITNKGTQITEHWTTEETGRGALSNDNIPHNDTGHVRRLRDLEN